MMSNTHDSLTPDEFVELFCDYYKLDLSDICKYKLGHIIAMFAEAGYEKGRDDHRILSSGMLDEIL